MTKHIMVIDLNVFVRALLTSGIDKAIYEAIKKDKIIPVFCPNMLENLAKVSIRPSLKLGLGDIKELMELIRIKALIVRPQIKITVCRDASDNIVLETAVASNTKIIVSNDLDLLTLNPFQDISIINPRQFLRIIKRL